MRKKLLAGQQTAAEGGPGADRAWRLSFARAVRDMMQVQVDFVGLSLNRVSLTEVLDLPPDRALILMLEGPEEGLGLLILSPELLSAMIEVLTIGKCGMQVPDPRRPTRTDAAMLSPLADLSLANLEEALAEDGDLIWASGFRYASFIEEARSLGLLLEDMIYRTLSAKVALAQGARVGEMILVLPAEGRGRKPRLDPRAVPESVARPAFSAALAARVEPAACQLEAVVARVSMTLADVMVLSADMILPLQGATLEQISIEGLDGRRVTDGKLGQHRGMRAVRLMTSGRDTGAAQPALGGWTHTVDRRTSGATWPDAATTIDDPIGFSINAYPATGTD
ncbi:MAG: FliM/FliN family flagellar motor switch protein [Paracoccaceae bacterium]